LAWQGRKVAEPAAHYAARTALALDQDEPWAHLALGYAKLYGGNRPEEAITVLNRALELNPSLATAHYLVGLSYSYIGQPERTFAHADLADASAPCDLLMRGNTGACNNVRATASWIAGRYREGAALARKVIAESPRQVPAYRALIINSCLGGEAGYSATILKKIKGLAPALPGYIKDLEGMYSRRIDYEKYVGGFRMAGLRLP
jgi:tetratricopeptide (TPR) repeat protein